MQVLQPPASGRLASTRESPDEGLVPVLIAEDDPISAFYIRSALRKMGFVTIYSVNNGRDALEVIAAHNIGLVLADWQMPTMTGLELLRELRAARVTRDIPVILITAEDRGLMVEEALQAKPQAYIVKPYTIAKIQETVARVVKLAGRLPNTAP